MLLSLYENGLVKLNPHKDDEKSIDSTAPIATLISGASRTMVFTKKGRKPIYCTLETGFLLLMHSQEWNHSIPREPLVTEGLISLAFRKIAPVINTSCPSISTSQTLPLKRALNAQDDEHDITPVNHFFKRVPASTSIPQPTHITSPKEFVQNFEKSLATTEYPVNDIS